MEPHHILWGTIFGYMALALTISGITSLWIRHHLKSNDLHPKRAIKKKYLVAKRNRQKSLDKR